VAAVTALDPEIQAVLDASPPLTLPGDAGDELERARRDHLAGTEAVGGVPEPVARVKRADADGVPVEIVVPEGHGPHPAVLHLHGGGWVVGSPASYRPTAHALANASGAAVVSVDYRLAPEHPFPAPLEDAETALRWLRRDGAALGIDPERLAVAGDSAGGNLAAVLARRDRNAGGPPLRFQLLVYPALDAAMDTRSYREFATGFRLTAEEMAECWRGYAGDADRSGPDLSPLRAPDLAGLPPALVITAAADPLRDEGEAYAAALREAGVPAELRRVPGTIHGFWRWLAVAEVSRTTVREAGAALRAALA
jgi:acetyl esterase/lipase